MRQPWPPLRLRSIGASAFSSSLGMRLGGIPGCRGFIAAYVGFGKHKKNMNYCQAIFQLKQITRKNKIATVTSMGGWVSRTAHHLSAGGGIRKFFILDKKNIQGFLTRLISVVYK